MMQREQFAGAAKASVSFVSPLERRMARAVVPRIPACLETHHLTMLTLAWCSGIVFFSWLAATDVRWMWAVSSMVVMQYVTDFFDGKVGKHRGTGLVKWGFYMDHLLDYVFLCSVVAGYALVLPPSALFSLLLVLAVGGAFMVNSFLTFAATEKFEISHLRFGPTEFRIALVAVNALLVLYGPRPVKAALPYVAAGAVVALCLLAYRTQKMLWRRDMERKREMSDE